MVYIRLQRIIWHNNLIIGKKRYYHHHVDHYSLPVSYALFEPVDPC